MDEESGPLKILRTKRLAQAQKAQDSTFYILVIQDHIESIGKANTIKTYTLLQVTMKGLTTPLSCWVQVY